MNKGIIVAVFIVAASGVIRVWTGQGTQGSSVTHVLLGANLLLIVLSVVDLAGPPLSTIAGGLAMLAALVVLLQVPWGVIFGSIGVAGEAAGTGVRVGEVGTRVVTGGQP